jgi:hypothetical protein
MCLIRLLLVTLVFAAAPAAAFGKSATFCFGEYKHKCGSGWRDMLHLSCTSDINNVARNMCLPASVKKIQTYGNRPGNGCGYMFVHIECAN